jgi:hypothetical protein
MTQRSGVSAVDIQLGDRRQRLSSRNPRSSWFPYMVAGVVTKASRTYETPDPTQTLRAAKSRQEGLC